jgi:putative flippase GtrA
MLKRILGKFGVHDKESFWQLFWQFFKFGLVGLSNTAVSMGIYYIFLFINPDLYMIGTVVGTVVSIYNAFFWNDRFVFTGNARDFKSKLKRVGKTYVSYGGTSLLSIFLLWLEVSVFGVSKVIAPVVNLIITIPLNFIINKFWTFTKSKEKQKEELQEQKKNTD